MGHLCSGSPATCLQAQHCIAAVPLQDCIAADACLRACLLAALPGSIALKHFFAAVCLLAFVPACLLAGSQACLLVGWVTSDPPAAFFFPACVTSTARICWQTSLHNVCNSYVQTSFRSVSQSVNQSDRTHLSAVSKYLHHYLGLHKVLCDFVRFRQVRHKPQIPSILCIGLTAHIKQT